jgi:hypothetical protein
VFRRRCTGKAIGRLYRGVSLEMYARGMGTEEAPEMYGEGAIVCLWAEGKIVI